METDALLARLARSEYESLRHVEFARHDLDEVFALGPDAAYALGHVYSSLGIVDVAAALHHLSAREAPSPWNERSGRILAANLIESDRPADALALLDEQFPSQAATATEILRARAIFLTEGYERLLAHLSVLGDELDELDPAGAAVRSTLFWRAIAGMELGREVGFEDARRLARDTPAGREHIRILEYLSGSVDAARQLSEAEMMLFDAKALQAEGRAVDAAAVFRDLALTSPVTLATPWGLLEFYRAGARSGRLSVTAASFVAIAPALPQQMARRVYEYAGRLYRLAGVQSSAIAQFDLSLAIPMPSDDARRVRWYRLSSLVRRDPILAVSELADIAPAIDDPEYFDDVLLELAGRLVERGAWEAVARAYDQLDGFASAGALARYELILAEAYARGVLAAAPARAEELRDRYLRSAADQRENLFAALVAATLLGESGVEQLNLKADRTEPGTGDAAAATELGSVYLRYGLLDLLFPLLRENRTEISPTLQLDVARAFAAVGRVRESVLVLPPGPEQSRELAELRYPLAFAAIVDRRSAEEELDRAIFYALVREESLFDPAIQSVAGAVGLSQLMPATALDIASRMRLDDPALDEPADNLAIGARYFSMLEDQFGTYARAIAAYNGGQGNVRRWERAFGSLSELLFHQSIPFWETYNHVRKVLVSAAYYGYLYEGRDPAATVRLIFPDIADRNAAAGRRE